MSNLKDTDIDDLFRRASEKYPLRTDSSDWDRMSAALEKDPPPPDDETDATDRRRKRRFFWLFLFLPLGVGGLGYYAWHSGAGSHAATTAKASVATETSAAPNTVSATQTRAANPTGASAIPTPATPTPTTPTSATPTPATPTPTTATPTTPSTTAGGATASPTTRTTNGDDRSLLAKANGGTNTGLETNPGRQSYSDRQTNSGRRSNNSHQGNSDRQVSNDRQSSNDRQGNADRQSSNDRQGGNDRPGNVNGQHDVGQQPNPTRVPEAGGAFGDASMSLTQNRQDRLFYDLQREPVDRNYQLKVNVVAPAVKKDSTAAKQKASARTKTSYLYAGLIGAPDLSTVKMQSVKGVGNTFGVLVGYAFNSHWAIETGVYLDRKKYYTEGQYFSTKEIGWLTSADTLKNVNGTCYMWEIPLNLRYTFNPEAKTRWFVTAGFTTYLMTKEKYTYNYEWSGWNMSKPGTRDSSSHYPFSIIGLSVGFEQKLGKVGNLRIEPYLRIPLTGMGVGKLPIMSTGINIGITRQLWKK